MNEHLKHFEYVKEQLIYLKTKVDVDNKLGLYDINKLSESLFANILNDISDDLHLQNANIVLHSNYPAIDLIDVHNKKLFQVTSTTTTTKIRKTIQLWKESEYDDFELNFFYLKNKPKLQEKSLQEFEEVGITQKNLLDITDILQIIESDSVKCKRLFDTLKIYLDTLSFEFNIKNYFDKFEPHLQENTVNIYEPYRQEFFNFIQSHDKVLEIYSEGGKGKSHLLFNFLNEETEYIPLIFQKSINILEDLKKLSKEKKFLLVYDDIDRFLDTNILIELLSYVISHENIKLIITYRKASKSLVKSFYTRYSTVSSKEIEIIWTDENIQELVKNLKPDLDKNIIDRLCHQYNKNPYLISQALKGDIGSIKDFSLKILEDTKHVLSSFSFSDDFISELLFKLSLTTPIHENHIDQLEIENIQDILDSLESGGILRKLSKRYRFNPDILGDLYLGYFVSEFGKKFERILERYLYVFSKTVFANLSYALLYSENRENLNQYLNNMISQWIQNSAYSNAHLEAINKIVGFVPEMAFVYLTEATKVLKAQENKHIRGGFLSEQFTKISAEPEFNQDNEAINLGSIEPIISQLIFMLKNNYDCGAVKIQNILEYLTSDKVLSLPKPYYDNHEVSSILNKLFSPLRTTNYQVILDAIDIATSWIKAPFNYKKIELFNKVVIQNLLSVTFDDTHGDGINIMFQKKLLNTEHKVIRKIIFKVRNIVLDLLDASNPELLDIALDAIRVNAYDYNHLSKDNKEFYSQIKKEFLKKTSELLSNQENLSLHLITKIDQICISILRFDDEKEEACTILEKISRTDELIFYQLIANKDFIISNFQKFYEEYKKQDDILQWMSHSQRKRQHFSEIGEDLLSAVYRLSCKYKSKDIVFLLNSLDLTNWGSYNKLLVVLDYWFNENKDEIIEVYRAFYQEIQNTMVQNVLKELLLKKEVLELHESDITEESSVDDLKIYIIVIFTNFNESKLVLLDKLCKVISSKENATLDMFLNIIASDIYFQLRNNEKLIDIFIKYIYKILELQYTYQFQHISYLTYSLELIKENRKLDDKLIDLLVRILKDAAYEIKEYELKQLYKLLDLDLEVLLGIICNKLVSKKEDGYYRYFFHNFMEYQGLTEVALLKYFVNSYEDFKLVVEKSYAFYNDFIEYPDESKSREIRIDLDWFFKYIVSKEYLERYFTELYDSNDIEQIKVFYKIVPVRSDYIDLLITNMNILTSHIDDKYLMEYLKQMNKIKSYSRSHMQNSNMILEEEKLFNSLSSEIKSLSLKLKIKEELKYIAIEKRREIEEDIERLMDK